MSNKCGHCKGTGACNCQICTKNKHLTYMSSLIPEGQKYVDYKNGDYYGECYICNGSGLITQDDLLSCSHCNANGICNCEACAKTQVKIATNKNVYSMDKIHKNPCVDYIKSRKYIQDVSYDYANFDWYICSICDGGGKIKQNITNISLSSEVSESGESIETLKLLLKKVQSEQELVAKKMELSDKRILESDKRILEYKVQKELEEIKLKANKEKKSSFFGFGSK